MSIHKAIEELSAQMGPPKTRATFGYWVPYAYIVRGLVEKGYGVTVSVKHVLTSAGIEVNKRTFGSVRAAFYKVKDTPWPEEGSE